MSAIVHESEKPSPRSIYAENLRKLVLAQHAQGLVPSAISVAQGITFATVQSILREAGITIPRYLLQDSAFGGRVPCCPKCGHELST